MTPLVEFVPTSGVWVRREEMNRIGLANGTKARAILAIADGGRGIVTSGGRVSTQGLMAAAVAKHLAVPLEFHTATGDSTDVLDAIRKMGGVIIQHRPGYTSVISARAVAAAAAPEKAGWRLVPGGMQHPRMVATVAAAVDPGGLPPAKRLVIACGSGLTLSGVLRALPGAMPVLGVCVGADPRKHLDKYAPANWRNRVTLVDAAAGFHTHAPEEYHGIPVDPIYSGKCIPFLQEGDLLWNSGARQLVFQAL